MSLNSLCRHVATTHKLRKLSPRDLRTFQTPWPSMHCDTDRKSRCDRRLTQLGSNRPQIVRGTGKEVEPGRIADNHAQHGPEIHQCRETHRIHGSSKTHVHPTKFGHRIIHHKEANAQQTRLDRKINPSKEASVQTAELDREIHQRREVNVRPAVDQPWTQYEPASWHGSNISLIS